MRILVIEDNPDILANVYGFLEPRGYALDAARNGLAGLVLAAEHDYDAVVLDLMLPGMDGLEVCRKLRALPKRTPPVLMLTARDTLEDKVAGFESGADDYLVKPFSLVELDLRLKALARRGRDDPASSRLVCGDLAFDPERFEATRAGRVLALTPTGYKILAALLRATPNVVRRDQLEREIWGDQPPDSDALRTHIHALRQALDKPFGTSLLRTLPGIGYRLLPPDA